MTASTLSAPVQTTSWFVAVVLTGHERAVKMRIDELDQPIETFLPLVETQAHIPAKPATRHRPARPAIPQICAPMFGGYLFVSLDPDDPTIDWERVREIRGYGRMLANAHGRPIPARGLEPIINAADRDGLVAPDALEELLGKRRRRQRELRKDDLVRILCGAFAEHFGTVDWATAEKVKLTVSCFNAQTDVYLHPEQVTLAEIAA